MSSNALHSVFSITTTKSWPPSTFYFMGSDIPAVIQGRHDPDLPTTPRCRRSLRLITVELATKRYNDSVALQSRHITRTRSDRFIESPLPFAITDAKMVVLCLASRLVHAGVACRADRVLGFASRLAHTNAGTGHGKYPAVGRPDCRSAGASNEHRRANTGFFHAAP